MKQILLTVAMLTAALTVGAQNKDQLLSSISKAEAATLNEKKAANPNTWIKYGDAFMDAYNKLFGDLWIGISKTEATLFGGPQPASTEQVTISGMPYSIEHYDVRDLYYNVNGVLDAVIITQPIMEEDLLVQARDAYLKAAELDAKGSKTKQLADKLSSLRNMMVNDAMSYYTLGNLEKAAFYFEETLPCSENPVLNTVDTMVVYYAAVTYDATGNIDKASEYYQKCIDLGYDMNGDVPAALAALYLKEGDVDQAKKCLNDAFAKYPTSQSVLVSLINLYMDTNDDPQKILDLIKSAQKNEPDNATLVYAEGNVYKSLGDIDNAIKCYQKSFEIDPNYIFGIFSIGNTYFEQAVNLQKEIDALDLSDIKGYEKLSAEQDKYLMMSIEPFEKVFAMATEKDNDLKVVAASSLKQIYFVFRDRDPKYAEKHKEYEAFLQQAGVEQ